MSPELIAAFRKLFADGPPMDAADPEECGCAPRCCYCGDSEDHAPDCAWEEARKLFEKEASL